MKDRQWMPSGSKSSLGLWAGELTKNGRMCP